MTIRPLHDRVLIRRSEEETTTASGIVLPGSATEKPMTGEVVAAGNGKTFNDGKLCPLEIKIGDKVLFGKFSGTEVKVDNEDLLMMREEDVMAIVE